MKKIFSALEENEYKDYLYQYLCVREGDNTIKFYWADCVIDAVKIEHLRKEGVTKFIIIFRRCGAEMCYNGYNTDIFKYYKEEEYDSCKTFFLDYERGNIFSVSWGEAEAILNNKV
jgi:hypothetical protein